MMGVHKGSWENGSEQLQEKQLRLLEKGRSQWLWHRELPPFLLKYKCKYLRSRN